MDLEDEEVIKQIYQSGIITDMETSKEYKKLLKRYNKFFDSIKAEKMKRKFEILEETKNKKALPAAQVPAGIRAPVLTV